MTKTQDDPSQDSWITRFSSVLTPRFFKKLAIGLGIGLVGGLIAHSINMPLAWMMGPMLATFVASLLRVPMGIPMQFRSVILGVIGIFLGASFTPDTFDQAARWPISMIAVLLYVPVITVIITWFYSKVARLDKIAVDWRHVSQHDAHDTHAACIRHNGVAQSNRITAAVLVCVRLGDDGTIVLIRWTRHCIARKEELVLIEFVSKLDRNIFGWVF